MKMKLGLLGPEQVARTVQQSQILWVYVTDMQLSQQGIFCDGLERTWNLCATIKIEMEHVRLESVTKDRREGKINLEVSNPYLGTRLKVFFSVKKGFEWIVAFGCFL